MFGLVPLPRRLPAALADANHEKESVRRSAVVDLGRLCQDEGSRADAIDALCRVLEHDDAARVRAEAALALADAEATESVPALLSGLQDAHERVRQMALVALGEVGSGDARAAEALESALADDAPAIRFQALIAAHRLLGEAAQEHIEQKMGDADPLVRAMALRLAEERFAEGRAPPPAAVLSAAKRALKDEDLAVRLAAAILLAKLGDRSGHKTLVAALRARRGTLAPEDEQTAIELCAELGLDSARPALERRAFGLLGATRDPFAWHARIALARLGDERAKVAILRGLEAWSRDARTLAVVAAGRAQLREARAKLLAMQNDPSRADRDAVTEALELIG